MLVSSKIKNGINGTVNIPGDKSISHRSIIIPSISKGTSEISNLLLSEDVLKTLKAFENMGVKIQKKDNDLIIHGQGLNSLTKPLKELYLGNSGTSARLLAGLLSTQEFNSILAGDESLSKRPMKRITIPLELMGAKFKTNNGTLPLEIYGKKLTPINYELDIPSAQVKSGIILAALNTEGKTTILEKEETRNHTEIMLENFDANIETNNKNISIIGKKELTSKNIQIPSDLSSAAFFIVAALINKNSKLNLNNINLNPTRSGIISALYKMGAKINISNKRFINGELVGDLKIYSSELQGSEIDESQAKLMIDEYPILSIAASFAKTPSLFRGLKELRVKESDRLNLIKHNLDQCGIFCSINNDDLFIDPSKKNNPKNNKIVTEKDHRIAMAFAIMGTKLGFDLKIKDSDYINTSFPNFMKKLNMVGGQLSE